MYMPIQTQCQNQTCAAYAQAYVHSNVAGMVNIMEEIIATTPIPKVVFASSSSIYGLNTKVPFAESDVTDTPASLYAATKKS